MGLNGAIAHGTREYVNLLPGDPAPWFTQRTASNPRFHFDTAAGRYIVLCFFGSAGKPRSQAALDVIRVNRHRFDDNRFTFFGVTIDPQDEAQARVTDSIPGIRYFWDFDGTVSRLYGAIPANGYPVAGTVAVRPMWFILDPSLRVLAAMPFADAAGEVWKLMAFLDSLPPPQRFAGIDLQPPVIYLPNVFEPDLCRRLIALNDADGGRQSGFMPEIDGKTVAAEDHRRKHGRDCDIVDPEVIDLTRGRIVRRVVPEMLKVYQFRATRIEHYIVACYNADDRGHFNAHRDNTTRRTAHRRFAVSINLNADFDGGEIRFPEYGHRAFKPPPGGAVIFSCSLLHAVSEVTRGRRYAFLPFLYNEEAAKLREANRRHIQPAVTLRENSKASPGAS